MNTCSTTDMDKTAQFFFPIDHNHASSPSKSQKSLQIIFIDPYKKSMNNIKLKRTNSQLELPRLQLYTEQGWPDIQQHQCNKTNNNKLFTPNATKGDRFTYQNLTKSNESSPQKMASQLSFHKIKLNSKPFLKCKPQQKIVTKIFGEL